MWVELKAKDGQDADAVEPEGELRSAGRAHRRESGEVLFVIRLFLVFVFDHFKRGHGLTPFMGWGLR